MLFTYDPYVTADTDMLEEDMDWSDFAPEVGTGSVIIAATNAILADAALDVDIDGRPEGLLSDFYTFNPYV